MGTYKEMNVLLNECDVMMCLEPTLREGLWKQGCNSFLFVDRGIPFDYVRHQKYITKRLRYYDHHGFTVDKIHTLEPVLQQVTKITCGCCATKSVLQYSAPTLYVFKETISFITILVCLTLRKSFPRELQLDIQRTTAILFSSNYIPSVHIFDWFDDAYARDVYIDVEIHSKVRAQLYKTLRQEASWYAIGGIHLFNLNEK